VIVLFLLDMWSWNGMVLERDGLKGTFGIFALGHFGFWILPWLVHSMRFASFGYKNLGIRNW
jgi:hypothetical protein